MKKLLLPFFFFAAINLLAQPTISGEVIDRATRKPLVNAAVRNLNNPAFITFTDTDGSFSLEGLPNNIIEVSYLGYTAVQLSAAEINKHQTLYLSATAIDLPEVVISAENALSLITKGINKYKANFLVDKSIAYLWHGIDEVEATGSLAESYAIYTATTQRKRGNLKSTLHLSLLKHSNTKNVDSSVVLKNNCLNVEIFSPIPSGNLAEYYLTKRERGDSIIVVCYPKPTKKIKNVTINTYIFRKKDTLLLACYGISVDSLCRQQKSFRVKKSMYKLITQRYGMTIEHTPSGCYLGQFYHSVVVLIEVDGQQEITRSINVVSVLKEEKMALSKDDKISPWSSEFHKRKANTTDDFWTKYLKE